MYMNHSCIKNSRAVIETFSGVLLLTCGCVIYLLFRSRSLNIYQWCSALGLMGFIDYCRDIVQGWYVPDVVRFCLPDGMYCASYILIVDAIWHKENGKLKYVILSLVPIITIGSELLQSLNFIRGTFDVFDLICYALPPLIYICFITLQKLKKEQQI